MGKNKWEPTRCSFFCDCYDPSHTAQLLWWDDKHGGDAVIVTLGYSAMDAGFMTRLKNAWKHIRGSWMATSSEVVLSNEQATKMRDALNEFLADAE